MAKRYFRTEEEYFATLNRMLKTASPHGAYCLAFAEVVRQESGRLPPPDMMEQLVACQTVQEGIRLLERVRGYQSGEIRQGD
jgi:hypothetical protein